MGLLDGQIAAAIYAGFKGKLLKGQLRRVTVSESGGLDDLGDPLARSISYFPFEGFDDGYDAAYMARAGIPIGDSKVSAFAKSLGTRPQKDDKLELPKGSGTWYQVRKVDSDPATALWVCQSYSIPPPVDS